MTASYDKYKAKNIRIRTATKQSPSHRLLIQVDKLSLGYGDKPLFEGVSFGLHEAERIRLHGRNGAGKTTLIQTITARAGQEGTAIGMSIGTAIAIDTAKFTHTGLASRIFHGTIATEKNLRIGLYEQEINPKYLQLTLAAALEQVLLDKGVSASDQRIKQLLNDYLFNPATDGAMPVALLSGGQKARFQLISMLADEPQVLILDEPTNHLDLPSIEELENALAAYHGAIIYISHDSYFADKLGGTTINLQPS